MNLCYLSLGSNQRTPERQLRCALNAIQRLPNTSITKTSSFYWSKAWGLCTQQNFCNLTLEIRTRLPPKGLLKLCQQIEKNQGRVRKRKWGPRTLDIDIILYADRRIRTKELTIPHPYCGIRDFVIIPLLEINPKISLLRI